MTCSTRRSKAAMLVVRSPRPQGCRAAGPRRPGTGGSHAAGRRARSSRPARTGWHRLAPTGLDRGLLIDGGHLGLRSEVGIAGVDPTPVAPGLQVVFGQRPLDRAPTNPYLLLPHHLPDAGGEMPAQGQPLLGEQLAGDGDHWRPHPVGEAGGRPGHSASARLKPCSAQWRRHFPGEALAEPVCRFRGPQAGGSRTRRVRALGLDVRGGQRVGHPPGLVDLGVGESGLVLGWRASVLGVASRGPGGIVGQGAPPSVGLVA
jgi:hypothetical protein